MLNENDLKKAIEEVVDRDIADDTDCDTQLKLVEKLVGHFMYQQQIRIGKVEGPNIDSLTPYGMEDVIRIVELSLDYIKQESKESGKEIKTIVNIHTKSHQSLNDLITSFT
ncbi:MAG: hypothetical protein WCI79_02200 [Candidatus Saccharibacteria bacterium]